ncbi:hypothetical protein J2T56_002991 [Natronobacillus azotifigens]
MFAFFAICSHLLGFVRILRDLFAFSAVCSHLFRFIRILRGLLATFHFCSRSPRVDRFSSLQKKSLALLSSAKLDF